MLKALNQEASRELSHFLLPCGKPLGFGRTEPNSYRSLIIRVDFTPIRTSFWVEAFVRFRSDQGAGRLFTMSDSVIADSELVAGAPCIVPNRHPISKVRVAKSGYR